VWAQLLLADFILAAAVATPETEKQQVAWTLMALNMPGNVDTRSLLTLVSPPRLLSRAMALRVTKMGT
jgi:hypothetical protein